jgi:hypothetical protein
VRPHQKPASTCRINNRTNYRNGIDAKPAVDHTGDVTKAFGYVRVSGDSQIKAAQWMYVYHAARTYADYLEHGRGFLIGPFATGQDGSLLNAFAQKTPRCLRLRPQPPAAAYPAPLAAFALQKPVNSKKDDKTAIN